LAASRRLLEFDLDLDLEFDLEFPKSITTDVALERRQAWDLGYGLCRLDTK
jgi:hypothetical protein